jgi:hypothetical protein
MRHRSTNQGREYDATRGLLHLPDSKTGKKVVVLSSAAQAVLDGVPRIGKYVIASRTVDRMRQLGAENLTAWIGPHICGGCYEVPREMADVVEASLPGSAATTTTTAPLKPRGCCA